MKVKKPKYSFGTTTERDRKRNSGTAFGTPAFAQLQREWYERLRDDGFVDSEQSSWDVYHGPRTLRAHARLVTLPLPGRDETATASALMADRAEYYRLAGWYAHDHVFPSRLHKRVWEYHAEGTDTRDMVALLSPTKGRWRSAIRPMLQDMVTEMLRVYGAK